MSCVFSASIAGPDLMAYNLKRRRKPPAPPKPEGASKFTATMLAKMAKDVQSGAMPVSKKSPWISVGDDRISGLRAIIRKSGAVTFHAMYNIGDSRPMITIGQFPETTIEEARHLANVVRGLARMGIDVQSGLHQRLLKELAVLGMSWRPMSPVDLVIEALRQKGAKIDPKIVESVKKELG